MQLALALRRLLRHRLLLAVGVLVAAVVGLLSTYRIEGSGLTARGDVSHASASTQILVDSPSSALANLDAPSDTILTTAATIANFAPNPDVLDLIGRHAGLSGSQIWAQGPTSVNLPRVVQEPTDIQRNLQVDHETVPYRLQFNQNPNVPVIGIDAQAPTAAQAGRLANATVAGLQQYITSLQSRGQVFATHRVVLRQLGTATGHVDAAGASKTLAVMAFVGVFAAWCVLMLAGSSALRTWRRSAEVTTVRRRLDGHPVPATAPLAASVARVPGEDGRAPGKKPRVKKQPARRSEPVRRSGAQTTTAAASELP